MLILSLAFLILALLTALLDLGGDAGTATRFAEGCFAISAVLPLASLISRYRRRDREITRTTARR
jgi:uncharacterized membrane protein YtjA (UPF0391 family)